MYSLKLPFLTTGAVLFLSACQMTLDTANLPGLSALQQEEPRNVYSLVRGHVKSGHWDKKSLNKYAHCHDGEFWRKDKGGSIETVAELREYYDVKGWTYEGNHWPPIMEELLTTGDVAEFKDRKSAYCFYKRANR